MINQSIYTARIAGQDWPGVAPGEWRRGVVTVRYRNIAIGEQQGAGFLATAPGMSAWAATADGAVEKLAQRARRALQAVNRGR
jgi:hypothetical protein